MPARAARVHELVGAGEEWQQHSPKRLPDPRAWRTHAAVGGFSEAHDVGFEGRSASFPSARVVDAMERSRWIYGLADDFDGEGSPGYSKQTWDRAVNFVRVQEAGMLAAFSIAVPAPTIGPGPQGSIDVHWKTRAFEVLVNIPISGETAEFYGDDFGRNKFEGTVDISSFNRNLAFLLAGPL